MTKKEELTEVGMYCESCGCYIGLPIGFARKCPDCDADIDGNEEPVWNIGADAGLD